MKTIITAVFMLVFLAGCGKSEHSSSVSAKNIAKVSEIAEIQNAYEACIKQMYKELEEDNPSTDASVMKVMYEGADQACYSLVVTTCKRGLDDAGCKTVLQMYK
ncbi:hypothetical protein QP938_10845 [Porticoccaceae bacterium LTM1]|nr:hypothetical protein QP938_10845 [Porticoccaceae bacterium LTM1]